MNLRDDNRIIAAIRNFFHSYQEHNLQGVIRNLLHSDHISSHGLHSSQVLKMAEMMSHQSPLLLALNFHCFHRERLRGTRGVMVVFQLHATHQRLD